MAKNLIQIAAEKLMDKKNRDIAIVMHDKPDGDAIGSAVALEEALKKIGKRNVDLIIHNKINSRFSPVLGENRVNKVLIPRFSKKYDILIMVDFSDPNRTVDNVRCLSNYIMVLDHHIFNKPFGDLYICKKVAATGVLVYELIKMITNFNSIMANALYLTIRSDTSSFRNPNTDSKSHFIASRLIDYGASIEKINSIYETRDVSFIYLMGNTLSNVKIDKKYRIAYLSVKRENVKKSGCLDEDVSFLIDVIRGIKDTDITFLFMEGIGNIRVSARSKSTPVNNILSNFSGGGHSKAAGCAIDNVSLEEAVNLVLKKTRDYIDSN
jgi:phosphoesterase RecJ-like protein